MQRVTGTQPTTDRPVAEVLHQHRDDDLADSEITLVVQLHPPAVPEDEVNHRT
jgi:hypothetical protein